MRLSIGKMLSVIPVLLIAAAGPVLVGAGSAGATPPSHLSYGSGSEITLRVGILTFHMDVAGKQSGSLATVSGKYRGAFLASATEPLSSTGTDITTDVAGTVRLEYTGTTLTNFHIDADSSLLFANTGFTHCEIATLPVITFNNTVHATPNKWTSAGINMSGIRIVTSGGTCGEKSYLEGATYAMSISLLLS